MPLSGPTGWRKYRRKKKTPNRSSCFRFICDARNTGLLEYDIDQAVHCSLVCRRCPTQHDWNFPSGFGVASISDAPDWHGLETSKHILNIVNIWGFSDAGWREVSSRVTRAVV